MLCINLWVTEITFYLEYLVGVLQLPDHLLQFQKCVYFIAVNDCIHLAESFKMCSGLIA